MLYKALVFNNHAVMLA